MFRIKCLGKNKKVENELFIKIFRMIDKFLDKLGYSTSKYRVKLCILFFLFLIRVWIR